MFFFTYLPQLAVLLLVNGPLAVITTVFLVLNESSTIVNVISRNFILQEALLDTFDGTLVARNATQVVSQGRQLKSNGDPVQRLGKVLKKPFDRFGPKALIRYLMYLPLNAIPGTILISDNLMGWVASCLTLRQIPVVGTVVFIILQGNSCHSSSRTVWN
jgi:hypothetical protein